MSTPHNKAEIGQIAKTVVMPGDPLRAKYIAEKFLDDFKLVNEVRNIYAYTGTYKGKEVTVMASGMGMASIGIYSHELYAIYGVENILRTGTAGGYTKDAEPGKLFIVTEAVSGSTFANILENKFDKQQPFSELASEKITQIFQNVLKENNQDYILGPIHSSDVFYEHGDSPYWKSVVKSHGVKAVEMESFALFANARVLGKQAGCICTISDSLVGVGHELTAEERQTGLNTMLELTMETAISL